MSKKYIGGLIFAIMLVAVCVFSFGDEIKGMTIPRYASDVIGTRTGTSTPVGVLFPTANTATTSYISKLGGQLSQATYDLRVLNASSSPDGANVRFSILASNDYDCNTSTTTTSFDQIVMKDIYWYDAGPFVAGLPELTAQTALNNGTTTFVWNTTGKTGTGKKILLNNLSAECLKLEVNASSTMLFGQIRVK